MSTLTAPFDGAWLSRLPGDLSVTSQVTVAGVPLEVISGTVTYDEDNTPHVTANIQCRVPSDQATLDSLDPRLNKRVVIVTGYRVPGAEESHTLCDLMLIARNVRRPDNVMELVAVSDEQKVMDTQPITSSRTYNDSSDGGRAIADLIEWAVPTAAIDVRANGTFVAPGDSLVIDREDNLWNAIQDIADRIGAWVYHDGLGMFHVVPQAVNAGAAVVPLQVGAGGTLTSSETQLSRETFANTVVVRYQWFDGTQRSAFGWAEVTSGPYSVSAVGRKVITVTIERKGSAAQAKAAAASMVRRAISRGRSMSLEFDHAPFWLRAGDTITAKLPTGPQERHFVKRVDFDIPSGHGHVTTRVPENVTIGTGE